MVLLVGCTGVKCFRVLPVDHTIVREKMPLNIEGAYNPYRKTIYINKLFSYYIQQGAKRHELCHVTEWKECLKFGSLTGVHSPEQHRIWDERFREKCKK